MKEEYLELKQIYKMLSGELQEIIIRNYNVDMNIDELYKLTRDFAIALGYSEKCVIDRWGDI